jgi:hypothetical protein
MLRVLKPGGCVGIRTTAADGILFEPKDEFLKKAWDIYLRYRQHNGGDPFVGAHLKSLLREAGFEEIAWSVTYDIWSTSDQVRSFMDVHLVEMTGPRIVEQVTQLGWASPEDFRAAEAAIRAWGSNPDAIFAVSMGEALGFKH